MVKAKCISFLQYLEHNHGIKAEKLWPFTQINTNGRHPIIIIIIILWLQFLHGHGNGSGLPDNSSASAGLRFVLPLKQEEEEERDVHVEEGPLCVHWPFKVHSHCWSSGCVCS